MTEDVLITISDIQVTGEEDSDVEMTVGGDYYQKNGKHYILYEGMMEGSTGKIKNIIRISPSEMGITKKRIASTHMQFKKNKKNSSYYTISLDGVIVGIQANRAKVSGGPDSPLVDINYSLDINYEHSSGCSIRLDVQFRPQRQGIGYAIHREQ